MELSKKQKYFLIILFFVLGCWLWISGLQDQSKLISTDVDYTEKNNIIIVKFVFSVILLIIAVLLYTF